MDAFKGFWDALDRPALFRTILRLAAVLLCLTVHEACHGLAAYALGDTTARDRRRLSFNPLRHIDWFGFAAMLLLGFGWAKPVPVDMRYFKNPKRGMALTALAGPVSNLLLALLFIGGARVILDWSPVSTVWGWYYAFLIIAARLSIGLGVFNLIPIPPLDGSKAFFSLLPDRQYEWLMRHERYGALALYALIFLGALDGFLPGAIDAVYNAYTRWILM